MPAPPVAQTDGGEVTERISWLRGYRGGGCFFATATSASDDAIAIEGFGTAAEPFEQLLTAFQSKFHLEPDISVRLIDAAQCEVPRFLHALDAGAAEKPLLALNRTSVPDGSPISGAFETRGGLRSNLLLIDHEGMAYNVDALVTVQSGKATFRIPLTLDAADRGAGKPLPQLIMAIAGDSDIEAASFPNPTPAAVALPKILAEIHEKGLEYSAVAKYFQLGG